MTILYSDFTCSKCRKEDKLMHEINDGNNKIVFPGEVISEVEEQVVIKCEYCEEDSEVFIKKIGNKFIGFANESELASEKFNEVPDTKVVFEKWKNEKKFNPSERINFNSQPFKSGKSISISGRTFEVKKVYRSEWVEKNIDIRLENPRPDTYWYEVTDENKKSKWLKVENVEGDNIFLSEDGIIITDNNEVIEEMTDNPSKIKRTYQTDWFGGREIEAYQYINGVRILVYNHKKQIEMDIFEDTFEESMSVVEENMELGVFNE